MLKVVVAIWGQDFAKIRSGFSKSWVGEELTQEERGGLWFSAEWERRFGNKVGLPLGEVLVWACDQNDCASLMAECIVAAAYRRRR